MTFGLSKTLVKEAPMCEQYRKIALPAMLIGVMLTALTLIFPKIGFLEWVTMVPALLFLLDRGERGVKRERIKTNIEKAKEKYE